jgi:hydroxyethylthiazole kinase-like sugar kinase family protein
MKETYKEQVIKMVDALFSWKAALKEVAHNIKQEVDCFTVCSGPWTIVYDSTKESEANNG